MCWNKLKLWILLFQLIKDSAPQEQPQGNFKGYPLPRRINIEETIYPLPPHGDPVDERRETNPPILTTDTGISSDNTYLSQTRQYTSPSAGRISPTIDDEQHNIQDQGVTIPTTVRYNNPAISQDRQSVTFNFDADPPPIPQDYRPPKITTERSSPLFYRGPSYSTHDSAVECKGDDKKDLGDNFNNNPNPEKRRLVCFRTSFMILIFLQFKGSVWESDKFTLGESPK